MHRPGQAAEPLQYAHPGHCSSGRVVSRPSRARAPSAAARSGGRRGSARKAPRPRSHLRLPSPVPGDRPATTGIVPPPIGRRPATQCDGDEDSATLFSVASWPDFHPRNPVVQAVFAGRSGHRQARDRSGVGLTTGTGVTWRDPNPEPSGYQVSENGVLGEDHGGLVAIVRGALEQFAGLTQLDPVAATGVRREKDGWSVLVDVVELERVPTTTSVMATYRVDVDSCGDALRLRAPPPVHPRIGGPVMTAEPSLRRSSGVVPGGVRPAAGLARRRPRAGPRQGHRHRRRHRREHPRHRAAHAQGAALRLLGRHGPRDGHGLVVPGPVLHRAAGRRRRRRPRRGRGAAAADRGARGAAPRRARPDDRPPSPMPGQEPSGHERQGELDRIAREAAPEVLAAALDAGPGAGRGAAGRPAHRRHRGACPRRGRAPRHRGPEPADDAAGSALYAYAVTWADLRYPRGRPRD